MLTKKTVIIIGLLSGYFVSNVIFCSESKNSAFPPKSSYKSIQKKQPPIQQNFTLTEEDLEGKLIPIRERRLSIDKAKIESTTKLIRVSHDNKITQSIDDSFASSGFWIQEGPVCTAVTGFNLSPELRDIPSSKLAHLLSKGATLHIQKTREGSLEQAPQFSITLVEKSEKT